MNDCSAFSLSFQLESHLNALSYSTDNHTPYFYNSEDDTQSEIESLSLVTPRRQYGLSVRNKNWSIRDTILIIKVAWKYVMYKICSARFYTDLLYAINVL